MNGVFLAVEGPDGAGKTTQAGLLADWLGRERGREVVRAREPGGTELGDLVRHAVLGVRYSRPMAPRAEALLFAAARAQLVKEVIRPAVARGAIVVADRFDLSSYVYQGALSGLGYAFLADLSDRVWPDLTIVLDCPALDLWVRLGARSGADRIEGRHSPGELNRAYRDALSAYPGKTKVVWARDEPDRVAARVREAVGPLLG